MADNNAKKPMNYVTSMGAPILSDLECRRLNEQIWKSLRAECQARGVDEEKQMSFVQTMQQNSGLEVVISGGLKDFLARQLPNGSFRPTTDIDGSDAILICAADQKDLVALLNTQLDASRQLAPIPLLGDSPENQLNR